MSITVYTKPVFPQCDATKRKLNQLGIPYTVIDLTQDTQAMQRVTEWGYRQAPVVEVGPDHHWCGFRPDLIAQIGKGA